jgi:hypothetical protein
MSDLNSFLSPYPIILSHLNEPVLAPVRAIGGDWSAAIAVLQGEGPAATQLATLLQCAENLLALGVSKYEQTKKNLSNTREELTTTQENLRITRESLNEFTRTTTTTPIPRETTEETLLRVPTPQSNPYTPTSSASPSPPPFPRPGTTPPPIQIITDTIASTARPRGAEPPVFSGATHTTLRARQEEYVDWKSHVAVKMALDRAAFPSAMERILYTS